ncbi:hypothetical protein HDU76_000699 [Blyttiomyces sp. JEL0837]|nr:hypothetical protein HDU76_000699 [Blyttiomyces sp. JEL0837]
MKFLILAAVAAVSMATSTVAQGPNRMQRLVEPLGIQKMHYADGSVPQDNTNNLQPLHRRGGGTTASSSTTSSVASTSSTSLSSITTSASSSAVTSVPASTTTKPTTTINTSIASTCTISTSTSTITYAGGPIMTSGINIYGVFYGDHSQDTIDKVATFVKALGKSSRWAVDRQYKDANGNHINDNVTWVGYYHDTALAQGTDISGDSQAIIDNAVAKMGWPANDPNGIYPIFAGVGITEHVGGLINQKHMCSDYCGYHDHHSNGRLYIVAADAVGCPGTLPPPGSCTGTIGCMQRAWRNVTDPTYSINGNQHADSMINVLIHEIGETASDHQAGYRDKSGQENADKCVGQYIQTYGEGANVWNVDFTSSGGSKYLVQAQWSLDLQKCVISA